jgi:hypothetical protein
MSVVIMNHPRNTDTSHKVRKEVRYPYKVANVSSSAGLVVIERLQAVFIH